MKRKVKKHLRLNTETVRNLAESHLSRAIGGAFSEEETQCPAACPSLKCTARTCSP